MIERLCDVMEKSGVGEWWYVKMLVMLSGCLCEEQLRREVVDDMVVWVL